MRKTKKDKAKKTKETKTNYTGHYFAAVDGSFVRVNGKRPTNQNKDKVQQKIATGLQKIDGDIELLELQKNCVKEVKKNGKIKLKEKGVDVAHHVAIDSIMNLMVDKMNDPHASEDEAMDKFIDDIISSDDEPSKEEAKKTFRNFRDENISAQQKVDEADKLAERVNRAHKNLTFGFASPNTRSSSF